ncbi:MAG: Bax inhibitor-1/YccA family protein [Lactobacillus crispatus]|jgi:FtsH-binding integral membrane protein|nr:Bax inhibitor-1/YccA family protein [Lactobacillus crispatus]MCI1335979.1 Bax inhibitor-1/YccA family protein [Lactobacillus crispatus]MCI1365405.1 Bax inhibitor-1/YccA family protein [Lactobacillus crispatus]MCI1493953.1 Bax inhibitor-1/YccA family protein [Lactobacillus crispatus]MCI1524159.1 Bax inhibitor-1/YccA family protein [Lactobacillus crispatus]
MDNVDQKFEHQSTVDESNLNLFLSKIYAYMALAVFVSAATAYLMMTTFASVMTSFIFDHHWGIWVIILLPLILPLIITFKSARNPVASFILLMITAVVNGITFSFVVGAYSGQNIASAFVAAIAVFGTMAIIGTITKKRLSRIGVYASAALIGLLVALVVNLFLENPVIDYVFSFIGVIIFTILTAWDAQVMRKIYLQYGTKSSTNGLAVVGALQLYLDFVNLFLQFMGLFGLGHSKI